jgi:hypothetical protein
MGTNITNEEFHSQEDEGMDSVDVVHTLNCSSVADMMTLERKDSNGVDKYRIDPYTFGQIYKYLQEWGVL